MAEAVRERMVRSAIVQLAKHGVQGASFAQVLAHSGAPRGSVYHHFPSGKQELIAAAMEHMGRDGLAVLDTATAGTIDDLIDSFFTLWHAVLAQSQFSAGCSIAAVTVTADSEQLLDRAAEAFRAWHTHLSELVASTGYPPNGAADLATMLIAAAEGAVVLARAQRSLDPLEVVRQQLHVLAGRRPK